MTVSAALDWLFERLATFVTAFGLTLALAVMGAQILFRYAFNDSLFWAEEVARYALVWSSMIGAAVAYRHGAHVAVTDFVTRLPSAVQRLVARIVHLTIFGFAAIVLWQGWALTMRNFARQQLSTALEMQIAWVYLSIPVAGALMMIVALECMLRPPVASAGTTAT